jgi:hypothetical protein
MKVTNQVHIYFRYFTGDHAATVCRFTICVLVLPVRCTNPRRLESPSALLTFCSQTLSSPKREKYQPINRHTVSVSLIPRFAPSTSVLFTPGCYGIFDKNPHYDFHIRLKCSPSMAGQLGHLPALVNAQIILSLLQIQVLNSSFR